jgi:hypothetical protein
MFGVSFVANVQLFVCAEQAITTVAPLRKNGGAKTASEGLF